MIKEVANKLSISEASVKMHRGSGARKMGEKSVTSLARMAAAFKMRRDCHLGTKRHIPRYGPRHQDREIVATGGLNAWFGRTLCRHSALGGRLFTTGDDAMRVPSRLHNSSLRLKPVTTNVSPVTGTPSHYVSEISRASRGAVR